MYRHIGLNIYMNLSIVIHEKGGMMSKFFPQLQIMITLLLPNINNKILDVTKRDNMQRETWIIYLGKSYAKIMVDQNVICNIVEFKKKKSLVILQACKLLLEQSDNHVVQQFKRCFRYLGMCKILFQHIVGVTRGLTTKNQH